jgi:hypothetical protein
LGCSAKQGKEESNSIKEYSTDYSRFSCFYAGRSGVKYDKYYEKYQKGEYSFEDVFRN